MDARGLVHRALAAAHVELRRKPAALIRSPHELQFSLELLAAHWVAMHPGEQAVAVQVGAFDGVSNDPLAKTIARYGWRAILVEPQPGPAAKLVEHYRGNDDVTVVQAAVGPHDGSVQLHVVEPAPGQPEWAAQIASFDRTHLERQARFAGFQLRTRAIEVPALTPATLLEQAGVERIDVLQIDTEGYDLEVLRLFDISRRRPSIVQFEHQHLNRRDRDAAAQLLVDAGYLVALIRYDTIAYLEP